MYLLYVLAMIPTPTLLMGYYHGLLMRDIDIDQLMDKMFSRELLTDQDQNLIFTGYSVYQRKCLMLNYARCMGTKQLLVFCNLVQELCPEIGSQLKIGMSVLTFRLTVFNHATRNQLHNYTHRS